MRNGQKISSSVYVILECSYCSLQCRLKKKLASWGHSQNALISIYLKLTMISVMEEEMRARWPDMLVWLDSRALRRVPICSKLSGTDLASSSTKMDNMKTWQVCLIQEFLPLKIDIFYHTFDLLMCILINLRRSHSQYCCTSAAKWGNRVQLIHVIHRIYS